MTHMLTKPMLADPLEDPSDLVYPVLATPKLDGIRGLILGGEIKSRSFTRIPNAHTQKLMTGLPEGLDGELIVDGFTFSQIQTAFMSEDGEPDAKFYVFDYVSTSLTKPYDERMVELEALPLPVWCIKVLPVLIRNEAELAAYEAKCLAQKYEGIMTRIPKGPYKCGRSSVKQGYLIKVKQFKDSEARVIGFEERLTNNNEALKDNFGRTKRSSHKANLVPCGTLGKFLVVEIGNTHWKGKNFAIGTGKGLTLEIRQEIWDNRDKYLGKIITYKYQAHGVLNLPRLPIWKGFRHEVDIGEPE